MSSYLMRGATHKRVVDVGGEMTACFIGCFLWLKMLIVDLTSHLNHNRTDLFFQLIHLIDIVFDFDAIFDLCIYHI